MSRKLSPNELAEQLIEVAASESNEPITPNSYLDGLAQRLADAAAAMTNAHRLLTRVRAEIVGLRIDLDDRKD